MDVLIVSPWYKPQIGGVVETVVNLVAGLRSRGVNITLLLSGSSNDIKKVGNDEETEIFSVMMRSALTDGSSLRAIVAMLVMAVPTLLKLRKFIRNRNISIVNVHFPSSQHIYFLLLKFLMPIKVVVSVHGSDIRVFLPKGFINRNLTRLLLRNADVVISCSKLLWKDTQDAIGGTGKARSEIVAGGVRSDWLLPVDEITEDGSGRFILSVGSLMKVKGFDVLIKAAGLLGDRLKDHKIHIVGGGPDKDELVELTRSLGLEDRVVFRGSIPHDDLRTAYRNALFYVLPSRSEGLPLVAMEAQAAGRAVIASSVGGIPEFIEDGVTGILVPAEDPEALSQQMARLIEDPALRKSLGENGLRKVKTNFTWDVSSRRYFDIFSTEIGG